MGDKSRWINKNRDFNKTKVAGLSPYELQQQRLRELALAEEKLTRKNKKNEKL